MRRALLFFLFIVISKQSFCFDMENYIAQHKNQKLDIFLENFPYGEYLKTISFIDFSTIQSSRYLVYKEIASSDSSHDGDGFVYFLADFFLKRYPITNTNELYTNVDIGEAYINPGKILNNRYQATLDNNATYKPNTNEAYQTIGYYILSRVAEKIKNDYSNKLFDIDSKQNQDLIKRLEGNKIYISFEEGQTTKLLKNIKLGKFKYVWDRIKIKTRPLICGNLKWPSWILFGVLVSLLFLRIRKIFKIFLLLIILPLGALKFTVSCSDIPAPAQSLTSNQLATPNFQQIPFQHLYPISKTEYLVNIYSLKYKNTIVGHSIWLKRPEIKSMYFAYAANSQFQNLKVGKQIIFAATGGYTTKIGNGTIKPDGFTIQSGILVNPVILHDRHGLIMFSEEGVRLINLNDKKIVLPNKEEIESPFNSIIAYSKLLKWCTKNKATIFQTHLLAYGDSLLISSTKAKSGERERRILAIIRDNKTQTVYHALFDITLQYDLASVSQEIFNIITSRGFKVEGIANLDTGSYNILNVFDENGNNIPDLLGPVDIKDATNLIVYYK